MSGDDDIIIAGEDPVETSRSGGSSGERCEYCGTELEWTLTVDCIQKRVCPQCSD